MKPRILEVTTVAATVRAFLIPLIEHLVREGFAVDAMCHGAQMQLGELCPPIGELFDAPWTRRSLRLNRLLEATKRVRAYVEARRYDIVHVHTPIAGWLTRFALRKLRMRVGSRVVYTAHGFHFHRHGSALANAAFRTLERLAGRWSDVVVVVNREDFEAAVRYRIIDRGRLRLIPGVGIDLDHYCPQAVDEQEVRAIRAQLGLRDGDSLFVMVAEFNAGKRHRDALRALRGLGRPSAHLAFAGDGPLQKQVRREARRLRLSRQVHFLGFQEDIRPLVRAARATLAPSEREGLSRAVMESLALEVPVLGSDARGVRDLLERGGGVIFPVGDTNRLTAAMAWALDHPLEAREEGRRGRASLHDLTTARVVAQYQQLFLELFSGR